MLETYNVCVFVRKTSSNCSYPNSKLDKQDNCHLCRIKISECLVVLLVLLIRAYQLSIASLDLGSTQELQIFPTLVCCSLWLLHITVSAATNELIRVSQLLKCKTLNLK